MTEVQSPDDAPLSDKRMNEESPVNDSRPEKAAEDSQWKVFVGGISRNTDENELFESTSNRRLCCLGLPRRNLKTV